jgi:hypothetical protein
VERHPQALIRLAHESVVKTEKEFKKTKTGRKETGKFVDKPVDYLEYSLSTTNGGYQKPFVYNVELEGTKSQYREQRHQKTDDKLSQNSKPNIGGNPANLSKKKGGTGDITITHERPWFFSKIDTANHLLVIDRTQPLKMERTPYFSTKYQLPTEKRTVSVKMNARLLKPGGEIVWMKDIKGEAFDNNQTIIPTKFISSNISQENEAFCGMQSRVSEEKQKK